MTTAVIGITHKVNHEYINQIVTVTPRKKSHLKYFLNNKFTAGRHLEDDLKKYYIGDGENIIYKKETRLKNVFVYTYKITRPVERYLHDIEFTIFADIPGSTGCMDCWHYRETYNRCLYYKKMEIKIKKTCVGFEQ